MNPTSRLNVSIRCGQNCTLLQVAVAKRHSEAMRDVPQECRPGKQTAFQSFWTALEKTFSLQTDKCAQYYEKLLVDPAYEVAPTQVSDEFVNENEKPVRD